MLTLAGPPEALDKVKGIPLWEGTDGKRAQMRLGYRPLYHHLLFKGTLAISDLYINMG